MPGIADLIGNPNLKRILDMLSQQNQDSPDQSQSPIPPQIDPTLMSKMPVKQEIPTSITGPPPSTNPPLAVSQIEQGTPPGIANIGGGESDMAQLLKQFQPEHQYLDQYNKLLSQYPQRKEPGFGRSLLAGLSGLSAGSPTEALNVQDLIRYRPYYRDLQDWQNRVKPVAESANLERYGNQTNRMMIQNLLTNQLGLNRLAETSRKDTAQMGRWDDQSALAWANLDEKYWKDEIARLKTQYAGVKFNEDEKGYAIALVPPDKDNPNGKVIQLIDQNGEPRKLAKMPEALRVTMQLGAAQKRVETQQAGATERTNITQAGATDRSILGGAKIFYDKEGNPYNFNPRGAAGEGTITPVTPGTTPTPAITPRGGGGIPQSQQQQPNMTIPNVPIGGTPDQVVDAALGGAPKGPSGPFTAPGAKQPQPPASILQMVDFAKRLYPQVDQTRQYAKRLDKAGFFGPITGRMRDIMAKYGTTGPAADIMNNMEKAAAEIMADPEIAKYTQTSNKELNRLAGGYRTSMITLLTGIAQLHARGRMGIQIINHLSGALSSAENIDMFNESLMNLDKLVKGYAADPKSLIDPNVPAPPTPLSNAVDKVLGGIKK